MNDYARNQASDVAGAAHAGGFPALVYSSALGQCFPCRILAEGAGNVWIEADYHGRIIPMCVPASIVLKRVGPEIVKN